jgi:hypothetical protein
MVGSGRKGGKAHDEMMIAMTRQHDMSKEQAKDQTPFTSSELSEPLPHQNFIISNLIQILL